MGTTTRGGTKATPRVVVPIRRSPRHLDELRGEPQGWARLGAGEGASWRDENLPWAIAVRKLLIRAPGRQVIDDTRRPLDFKAVVPLGRSELDPSWRTPRKKPAAGADRQAQRVWKLEDAHWPRTASACGFRPSRNCTSP